VLAPLLAVLIRVPLVPILHDKVPYTTFYLALAVSAILGGFGPGLVATVLGAILGAYFVVPPFGSLALQEPGDYVGLALFLFFGTLVSYLAGQILALRRVFERTLFSIGDAVISTDKNGRVRLMNPTAERLTGWTLKHAEGRPMEEVFRLIEEGSEKPVENPARRILATRTGFESINFGELMARTGERIPVDLRVEALSNERGQIAGAVLVFRENTETRRVEREREAAQRRARIIHESIADAFVLLDHDWRFAEMNSPAERIANARASELLGKSHWEVYPETLGTPLEHAYRKAVAEQVPVHLEYHYEPWDRWFEISAFPSAEGLAIYYREITERKRSEAALQRINEDLKQFTFAVSHDLREPLRMINVYMQLLRRRLGPHVDEQANGWMCDIASAADRIARLSDGVLQFSHVGAKPAEVKAVDTRAAVDEAVRDLQVTIREANAQISYDGLPQVMGEHTYMTQLFQNLLANAIKYAKPDSAADVRISARREGPLWVFAVQDNGIGIAPEYQTCIFEPFKRLHGPEIPGTGIGLATCKRIVERYGGRMWVESRPGEGATFYFSLPAALAATATDIHCST
jgi:PAS domain S-box-containing protein